MRLKRYVESGFGKQSECELGAFVCDDRRGVECALKVVYDVQQRADSEGV